MLVVIPVGSIVYKAFSSGLGTAWHDLANPSGAPATGFEHALVLTLIVAVIAVPLNAAFGVIVALVLARHRFPGARLLDTVIDLPVAVSPVVVGLALVLVYGRAGWFGGWLAQHGHPGHLLDPRHRHGLGLRRRSPTWPVVLPVLQEIGTDQEQAAATLGANPWQIFWRVTLPSIRWGLAYGVTLTTARVLGEFGALSGGGRQRGGAHPDAHPVRWLPLDSNLDQVGADVGALILALVTLAVLVVLTVTSSDERKPRPGDRGSGGLQALRRRSSPSMTSARGPGSLAHRAARAERLRQVDAAPGDRGTRDPRRGRVFIDGTDVTEPRPPRTVASGSASSTTRPSGT